MQGYANTKALAGYNASERASGGNSGYKVLPIDLITQYASGHPAPTNSSGWYWPSIMELKYICWGQGATVESTAGLNMLNVQLGKLGISSLQLDYAWSSTESYNLNAWLVAFDDGSVGDNSKSSPWCGVCAVLAF